LGAFFLTKTETLTNIFIEKEVFKTEKESSKKEEKEMPAEAKLLLEMIQKAGDKGVTREDMRNTPLGDLFMDPNGFDWLESHRKIECHARITEKDVVNTWFLWKEREGEELPGWLKKVLGIS
jgi:hypothetical protein